MKTEISAVLDRVVASGTCSFCGALATPGRRLSERSVVADDGFVAWVSIGALVDGHLLVVPRRHILSMAELTDAELEDLRAFLSTVVQLVSHHFGDTCVFEHGAAKPGSPIGCSVDHAHLHVLPWDGSLTAASAAYYANLPWQSGIDGLEEAFAIAASEPYLVVQDSDGRTAVAVTDEIPSQALRRMIVAHLGRPDEWDWKSNPQPSRLRQTHRKLEQANQ